MKMFLSQSEEEQLRKQHRGEKNRRVADRIKSVLLSNKGWRLFGNSGSIIIG